jgi:succinoglycan biosynthesis protein ExoA
MQQRPELTVVMPVRNEAAHIRAVLGQICAQTLPADRYEIIVVDGYSEDETRAEVLAMAAEHPHIHLLYNPRFTSGAARNIGAAHARSPRVLFVDGHCEIASATMLESALAAFERGERCLSRPQPLLSEGGTTFQQAVVATRNSALGHQTGSKIFEETACHCNPLSAGCGYDRALYEDLGGVDEAFDAAEDLEFNLRVHRAGVDAYHDPDFTVAYVPRAGWRALFRQLYRYGYGRALMARKYPGTVSPPAVALAGFVLWLFALPLLGLVWGTAWSVWASVAAFYGAAVLVAAGQAASWRPGGLWGASMACFSAIHLGAGLGYLSGLVGGPGWRHTPRPEVRRRVEREQAEAAAAEMARGPVADPGD